MLSNVSMSVARGVTVGRSVCENSCTKPPVILADSWEMLWPYISAAITKKIHLYTRQRDFKALFHTPEFIKSEAKFVPNSHL